jgi:hypothetical protein
MLAGPGSAADEIKHHQSLTSEVGHLTSWASTVTVQGLASLASTGCLSARSSVFESIQSPPAICRNMMMLTSYGLSHRKQTQKRKEKKRKEKETEKQTTHPCRTRCKPPVHFRLLAGRLSTLSGWAAVCTSMGRCNPAHPMYWNPCACHFGHRH